LSGELSSWMNGKIIAQHFISTLTTLLCELYGFAQQICVHFSRAEKEPRKSFRVSH
jgi:hypothetical protein